MRKNLCGSFTVFAFVILFVLGCYPGKKQERLRRIPVLTGKSARPTIVVYVVVEQNAFELQTKFIRLQIVMAVWSDGTMIYSKNAIEGGAPYYQKRVSRLELRRVLSCLEKHGVFSISGRKSYYGPSSSFSCIYIANEGREILLKSWHELYEKNPKIIATQHGGMEALGDRDRHAVVLKWSSKYKEFREQWTLTRTELKKLIEVGGEGRVIQNVQFEWSD